MSRPLVPRIASGHRRQLLRLAVVGIAIPGWVSCADSTAPCGTPVRVAGSWAYSALQTAPATASITGTLRLSTSACGQFTGSLEGTERDATGASTRLAGDVSGTLADSTTVEFDVFLPGRSRQHLAVFRGDSLKGDWFEAASGGASGSFVARRIAVP
jgi:hypothetical protein